MSTFRASVQFGDFKGTAAADNADGEYDLTSFLHGKGLMQMNEFLIAAALWVGESKGGKIGGAYIKAYLFDATNNSHDTVKAELDALEGPVPVRTLDIPVSAEEFIGFFKRFSVMLTRPSLNLDGREFSVQLCNP